MAKVRKRILQSGVIRWSADYTDSGGIRRVPTFPSKREADAHLAKVSVELRNGVHTADSTSITVKEAGELWLARCEANGLERATLEQYRSHLAHIVPLLGHQKLSRLSTPAIEIFADELVKRSSRALAKKVLTSLKSLIREAQRRGLVAQNVAAPVRIEIAARHDEAVVIPTKADLRLMLENVSKLADRWRPLLITAVLTGLRASELRGLTWSNVDLEQRLLRIRQRADKYNAIGAPKSRAGRRDVPLSPLVTNTLKEWRLRCPKGPLGLVFPNTRGTVMHIPDILRLCWYPLLERCGLIDDSGRPLYEFHHLRHAAASLLIEQGGTPKRVQTLLGHSSIRVTFDIYGHLFADAEADLALVASAEKRLFS